jgi:predicted enzyme related to lactoylglutathione lyase
MRIGLTTIYADDQDHAELRTADCQSGAERLNAKGVVFVTEPTKLPYGGTDAVFDDTCPNLLDLHQG